MSVEGWGAGKPDYYVPVVSSRPQILDDVQVKWSISFTYLVGAQAVSVQSFYTVPAGYTLEIGGGFISCKDSCIQKLRIVADSSELIGDFRYDMQGHISFSPSAGQIVETGEIITLYVYNNDTLSTEFSITLIGVLIKI